MILSTKENICHLQSKQCTPFNRLSAMPWQSYHSSEGEGLWTACLRSVRPMVVRSHLMPPTLLLCKPSLITAPPSEGWGRTEDSRLNRLDSSVRVKIDDYSELCDSSVCVCAAVVFYINLR